MRQILAIFVVALLFSQTVAFAETKEIIAEGTYNMGDGETPTVAESRAMLQAKRTAVEEAVHDFQKACDLGNEKACTAQDIFTSLSK